MDRGIIAKKSAIVGLISQLFLTISSFLLRKIFLDTMGVEYLGVNSTLTQILGTLALSELGVQTVIIYKLFKPIVEKNYEKINEIISFFKKIYQCIGVIIIVVSIICIPFIELFIKNVSVDMSLVKRVWIIMAFSSGCSYFLSYNRALLCADQKEYITKVVDLLSTILCVCIKIFVLIVFKSFVLYILIDIFNMLLSNIIILRYRKKTYSWLKYTETSKELKKEIYVSVKDAFAGRLSGYVFNSTDGLVISSLIGTAHVGLVGNYTTITVALKNIIYAVAAPIQNLIGNFIVKEDNMNINKLLKKYEYIIFIFINVSLIPALLLLSDFVYILYGSQYVLNDNIVFLLIAMEYTTLVQIPVGALVDVSGLFKEQRKYMLISAIINIVLSIIGALTIGIIGVFIGTIIGNVYNWYMRAKTSYAKVIKEQNIVFAYIIRNIMYVFIFTLVCAVLYILFAKLFIQINIVNFFVKAIIAEMTILIIHIILFGKTEEFKYILKMVKK